MNETMIQSLLLIHVIASLLMIGAIWLMPNFRIPQVDATNTRNDSIATRHDTVLTTRIIAIPMVVEGISGVLLFWFAPIGVSIWLLSTGMLLLLGIWILTIGVIRPSYQALLKAYDEIAFQRLRVSSWGRAFAWTIRGFLVIWMCWNSMNAGSLARLQNLGMARVEVGQPAPDFSATTQDGQRIRLSDYRGKRAVVLFFYPKDGTSVCTKEACAFRDSYERFVSAGVEVIGVSSDSEATHQGFIRQHKLNFPLISDSDGSLRATFAVPNSMGVIPGRVTYVIDKAGVIRHIFSALFASDEHVQQALTAVNDLAPPAP